jgi:hypothetical protein
MKGHDGVVWEGNGTPIVAILTGTSGRSRNEKTGPMQQLWILPRFISPTTAVAHGLDTATCGQCPFRGNGDGTGRACYVVPHKAPQTIWRKYERGGYGVGRVNPDLPIRLGAYGDPAMMPYEVVRELAEGASRWTGYTHQWRWCDRRFRFLLMASCTPSDASDARADEWRCFIAVPVEAPVLPAIGVLKCPATNGALKKQKTCATCGLCDGRSLGHSCDIWIRAHGTGKARVK